LRSLLSKCLITEDALKMTRYEHNNIDLRRFEGVVGGGDGHVVWRECCMVSIYVIRFRRLQVWRHLSHSWLIFLQRTPGSFVVVRVMVVVVVRVGGRGASDFACLVAYPPSHWVFVIFTISMLYSVCVVVVVVMRGGGVVV